MMGGTVDSLRLGLYVDPVSGSAASRLASVEMLSCRSVVAPHHLPRTPIWLS
jgi:hypothetical protein